MVVVIITEGIVVVVVTYTSSMEDTAVIYLLYIVFSEGLVMVAVYSCGRLFIREGIVVIIMVVIREGMVIVVVVKVREWW